MIAFSSPCPHQSVATLHYPECATVPCVHLPCCLLNQVDGDAPENQHPVQQDEDAGLITLGTLPVTDLLAELNKLESEGYAVWVGLWNIAMGMSLSSFMPGLVKQPAA